MPKIIAHIELILFKNQTHIQLSYQQSLQINRKMSALQYNSVKPEFQCKNIKTRINSQKLAQVQNQNVLIRFNESHLSPRKKPTSFRELSGSKQKSTQLFSSKKKTIENKLNTLRNNERCGAFQEDRNQIQAKASDTDRSLKEGLFSKLITTLSPVNIRRNLQADFNEQNPSINKFFDVCFSTFKAVQKNGNENICHMGNTILKKTTSSGSEKAKGLKFKGFPHKKCTLESQSKFEGDPQGITHGLLIRQRVRSPVKECCQKKIDQSRNVIRGKPKRALQIYGPETSLSGLCSEADEVIRSREGSMAFDMSPTLQ